jgi:hypothetical protein
MTLHEFAIKTKAFLSDEKLSQEVREVLEQKSNEQFANQKLENGSLISYDGDQITKGEPVYVTSGQGNKIKVADGEYKTADGDSFTIDNGVVSAVTVITKPAKEDKPVKQLQAKTDKTQKPYGEVDYADPGYRSDKVHRYPIDTVEHIRAAWNYIHKPANEALYNADDLSKVKGAIETAWKKKIDPAGPPADAKHEDMTEDGSPVTMDADSVDMSKQTMDDVSDDVTPNAGSGGDVEVADSPSNEDFDSETPTTAAATVDVNDLIDAKLAPVCQAVADLQAVIGALQSLLTSQSTQMSAVTATVEKIANLPAAKSQIEEIPAHVAPAKFRKADKGLELLHSLRTNS